MVVPRISHAPPAVTTATTNASSVQAVTSSTAAQVRAVEPIGVFVKPRSSRMRASTGNAVMLMAIPMKRLNAWNGTPGGACSR